MSKAKRLAKAALAGILLAMPAVAQAESATYDIYFKGLKAAELTYSRSDAEGYYAVNGGVRAAGVLGKLVKFRFGGDVTGRYGGDLGLMPKDYAARNINKSNESKVTIQFVNGSPVSVTREPERKKRPHDIDPAGISDVIDPISATVLLLSDRQPGRGCAVSLDIFDGVHQSRIEVSEGKIEDGKMNCRGEYVRVAGYPPDEMAEGTRFPFTLNLRENESGGLTVTGFYTATTFGVVKAERR